MLGCRGLSSQPESVELEHVRFTQGAQESSLLSEGERLGSVAPTLQQRVGCQGHIQRAIVGMLSVGVVQLPGQSVVKDV